MSFSWSSVIMSATYLPIDPRAFKKAKIINVLRNPSDANIHGTKKPI